jgi:magnesium transporter
VGWRGLDEAWGQADSRIWLDLENPSAEDVRRLDTIVDLDDDALADCLDGPARPRVVEYEDYLALFLYGVLSVDETGRYAPCRVVVFCSDRFLVTLHPAPMLSIASLAARCEKHGASMFEHGVDLLLYRLVDRLVENYLTLLDHLDEELDQLEQQSLASTADDAILQAAARLRNDLIEVRRLAAAQRAVVSPIARGEFDYVSSNLGSEFDHVAEHLEHAMERIDGMRERIAGALQNYHAMLTKRTNEIVRVLTVFAAVLLPLSLVAGIYGMNVPLWPPAEDPRSFWAILGAMILVGAGLLWVFRERRWL